MNYVEHLRIEKKESAAVRLAAYLGGEQEHDENTPLPLNGRAVVAAAMNRVGG